MKKALTILLTVVMVACMLPISLTASAETSGYYTYSISFSGATITDVDSSIIGNVTIPSNLGGYPVTSIGDYAFYKCPGLTSITIPNSVTSIGRSAFSDCSGLTSITIPNSVTSIGFGAFFYCIGLTSITIGNSVTSIGYGAFSYCDRLTSITIPNSVTSIGGSAFSNCTGLTSVTIGNSVTSIEDSAFFCCAELANITIPNSVTSIGDYAFCHCTRLTSIIIPDSVTSIGFGVFNKCTALTNVWYTGSINDKNDISIDSESIELFNATWHYNTCDEDKHVYKADCVATCTNCEWVRTSVDEHTYNNTCDTTCNGCGFIREVTHKFEWVVDQEENCGVNGIKHQECIVCGATASENTYIPATGNHTYTNRVDAECNVCGYFREIKQDYAITTDDSIVIDFSHEQDYNIIVSDNSIAEISDLNSSVKIVNGVVTKVTQATISPLKPGYVLIQIISDGGEVLSETVLLITEGKKKTYGDCDGDGEISATDALAILQASVGKIEFTDAQKIAADVNGDGEISATDALAILQFAVGKIDKFPVEQ